MINIEYAITTPHGVPEGTPPVDRTGKQSAGMPAFPALPASQL
jgi:hypothetical protein